MKKLFLLVLSFFLSVSVFSLDLFKFSPIKGNIKSYTQNDFSIVSRFGDLFRILDSKVIYNFDDNGLETEIIELNSKDVVSSKTVNLYDQNNNLIEQDCYDSNNNLLWKTIIAYKDNLKVDSSEYGKYGTLRGKVIYTYNENKQLTEETGYDEDGALVWKTVYRYDGNNIKTISQYDYNGLLDSEETYTYTSDNKIESITSFDSFTKITTLNVFRYSSNNVLNDIITYDNNKQITNRLMIKYDTLGNIAKVSSYNVAEKFGTTVNELQSISEYVYSDSIANVPSKSSKQTNDDAK